MSLFIGMDDKADIASSFSGYCDDGKSEAAIVAELADAEILVALYEDYDYEGNAFVLYRKDGKLYEVNGSHCSCYGLEGQWSPEETTVAALDMRELYIRDDEPREKIAVVIAALKEGNNE